MSVSPLKIAAPSTAFKKFATEGGDLAFKISGRTAAEDIFHPENGALLVPAGTVISAQMADQIDALGISVVQVRSVLTCQTADGVCAKCYGNDLTTNELVNVGEAVGIIAAQSIGEPGTQLTMRTFHTGGAVEDVSEARQRRILSKPAELCISEISNPVGQSKRRANSGSLLKIGQALMNQPTRFCRLTIPTAPCERMNC